VWRERGGFTQERIWQRFGLAMAAGQDGLARYLYNLLQGERRIVAERWLAIHADPGRIRQLEADQPYAADLALHGLRVLVHRDSVATAPLFDQLQARYRRGADPEWNALQRQLAVFVAARGHPSAAERLAAIPEDWVDEQVEAWRIRVALRAQDWPEVLRQTERLSATSAQQLRWRYWRARALEALGELGTARTLYAELASQRDYYGFLAADRLQQPYAIIHRPSAVPEDWMATSAGAALLRIRELTQLERDIDARREWQYLLNNGSPRALRTAAVLADRWGWHRQAVVALVRADEWDDLMLRFPVPYREQVLSAARTQGIDAAWIYAVIRQESLFQEDARSSANALGLMQILPTTGQRIARERGETWQGSHRLLYPPTNIYYGAHYLRGNLQRLQNNPVLASAAYNAGARRVMSWLPEDEPMDADIWAETIPFFETRGYIRRVMEYYVVYGWRLGGELPALQALMPPVRPR
jgi:soluble lytic murein transglycosylase